MSKLIRDSQPQASGTASSAVVPLSAAAVVTHLKYCQNLAQDHVSKAFDLFLKSLIDTYEIEIDNATNNKDATEMMGIQRSVRKQAQELKRYFNGYYLEGFVKFSKKKLNTTIGTEQEVDLGKNLSIVDNEALEESIAISSITQRIDTYFAEPLWALNQRFSILNTSEPVTESSNPVSPIQFCDALRRALKILSLNSRSKALAYKVFDLQLISLFRLVSEDINSYLGQQGILPNLKYTLPKGAAAKSYLAEENDAFGRRAEDLGIDRTAPNLEAGSEECQVDLVSAIRNLHQQLRSGVPVSGGAAQAYTGDQVVGVLGGIQGDTKTIEQLNNATPSTLVPININDVVGQLQSRLKHEGGDAAVKRDDIQTIDLVGMVFEYMLNDENIPDSVKTLLSYLHTPFLKIAFIDPGFFERTEHPARVLLNSLADAGSKWIGNDGSSQFDIYEQIKGVVNRVLRDFKDDVKIITSLLFEFNSYVKKVSRKQELTEMRAKEKAEGEDKLREMKLKVNSEVRQRIKKQELPSAVLLLLLQPWSDYLTFILLRHGDQSEAWHEGVIRVDDVLWCLKTKIDESDKKTHVEKLDEVVAALKAGFEVIGYDTVKGEKLISSFVSQSALAESSKKIEAAPEPVRNELERISAEKAGHHAHDEEDISPEEAQMVESLKMIEFGTWFEMDGGKRLKVAWYNGRTSHYMLVDQMGKRVDMQSGLALARKMISGTAKIISGSSKPFFERALENIYQKLNEKAVSIQSEESHAEGQ